MQASIVDLQIEIDCVDCVKETENHASLIRIFSIIETINHHHHQQQQQQTCTTIKRRGLLIDKFNHVNQLTFVRREKATLCSPT